MPVQSIALKYQIKFKPLYVRGISGLSERYGSHTFSPIN